ncbi:hypothetical protein ABBQ32_007654 [Trebouxia sp. C0010 RCD-2024]
MTPVSVVRGFDYGIIGVSGLIFLFSCIAALTVVPWRRSNRESHAIKSFNGYWHARALLLLTGGLWVLVQILRLDSLWTPESVVLRRRSNITNWTREGLLCRLYLTLSLGAFQPLFLLLSLMLCQGTLSRHKSKRCCSLPNLKAVALAFIWALPILLLQSVVAWISIFFNGDRWEGQSHKFLHYFFAAYQFGNVYTCGAQYANRCALCVFPAVADIVSVAFTAFFLLALLATTRRMIAAAINRRIQRRLRIFQAITASTLVAGEALRTCTLVSTPYHWTFHMVWVMYWLSICLLVTTTTWLLAIQPVRSAKKAAKEHAAWLEEPQELTRIDSTKTDPLLGDSSHGEEHAGLKVDKDNKKGQALENVPDEDVTDSAAQKKITDKLSQV